MFKPHHIPFVLLVTCSSASALPTGLWESQVDYEMVGVPIPFEPYRIEYCIDAAHPAPKIDRPGQFCQENELSIEDDTISWKVDCSSEFEQVTGDGKGSFTANSSQGEVQVEVRNTAGDTTAMVYHFTGKRLGECE